eukprot:2082998-Rhodomonas_salina.2
MRERGAELGGEALLARVLRELDEVEAGVGRREVLVRIVLADLLHHRQLRVQVLQAPRRQHPHASREAQEIAPLPLLHRTQHVHELDEGLGLGGVAVAWLHLSHQLLARPAHSALAREQAPELLRRER